MEVFKRFEAAIKKYLSMKVHYLGYITEDKAIRTSISAQRPVLLQHPEALASRCFTTLATVLCKQFAGTSQPHRFSAYWKDLALAPAAGPLPEQEVAGWQPTPDELWSQIDELIQNPTVPEAEIGHGLAAALRAYLTRFNKFPVAGVDQLLSLLEQADYSPADLRTLIGGLDALLARRFHAPPATAETRNIDAAPEPLTPNVTAAAPREDEDKILRAYRASAERIQAEETLLHQALTRLYSYINRELVFAGNDLSPAEGRQRDAITEDEGSRLAKPGPE
jgi:hypothetical protein